MGHGSVQSETRGRVLGQTALCCSLAKLQSESLLPDATALHDRQSATALSAAAHAVFKSCYTW